MQPRVTPGIVFVPTNKTVSDGTGKRYKVVQMIRDTDFKYLPMPKYK